MAELGSSGFPNLNPEGEPWRVNGPSQCLGVSCPGVSFAFGRPPLLTNAVASVIVINSIHGHRL